MLPIVTNLFRLVSSLWWQILIVNCKTSFTCVVKTLPKLDLTKSLTTLNLVNALLRVGQFRLHAQCSRLHISWYTELNTKIWIHQTGLAWVVYYTIEIILDLPPKKWWLSSKRNSQHYFLHATVVFEFTNTYISLKRHKKYNYNDVIPNIAKQLIDCKRLAKIRSVNTHAYRIYQF